MCYESTPSAKKLGWNALVLLRNSVENFCSHMAYGLRMHNRDHPDDQMTVIDLVELVQQHPDNLDAPLAYGVLSSLGRVRKEVVCHRLHLYMA